MIAIASRPGAYGAVRDAYWIGSLACSETKLQRSELVFWVDPYNGISTLCLRVTLPLSFTMRFDMIDLKSNISKRTKRTGKKGTYISAFVHKALSGSINCIPRANSALERLG